MSDSVRPHRRQPTRVPRPWDSPGKNTGVGCHFLLQCMKVKSESEVAQSFPTLGDPMDCNLSGSSIHEIFPGKSTGVGCHYLLQTLCLAHHKCYKCDSSYSPVWFIEKGVWRKEMNLTGDECFKEEFADTETFELSLKGWVLVCWGKVGRRMIPSINPHSSKWYIWKGPFHLLSSQGVGRLLQMKSAWQPYHHHSTPSSALSSLLLD